MSAQPVPLTVWLEGQRVVVVGAGPVAVAKLASLEGSGARVDVVAPDAQPEIVEAAAAGTLAWQRRAYRPDDLDGAVLAIAATADPEVNAAVLREATARDVLCVRSDGGGTAALASAVRRGPLLFTVSTQGAAPSLTRRLREQLEDLFGPEYGELAVLLGELRADPEVAATMASLDIPERKVRWRAVLDTDILSHIRNGRTDIARKVAIACLSSSTA